MMKLIPGLILTINPNSATTSTGQDTYFPSDGTIDRASLAENPYGLPRDLHHVLMIQHFCCQVHRTLNDSYYNRPGRTFNLDCTHLLRVLEDELKSLEMSLGRQLSCKLPGYSDRRLPTNVFL